MILPKLFVDLGLITPHQKFLTKGASNQSKIIFLKTFTDFANR